MSLANIIYTTSTTAIEWSITAVRTRNADDRDIVVQLDWHMLGTRLNSINQPVSALRNGTIVLDYDPTRFTDFSALTQDKLINWVNIHLGVDKINLLRKEINIELDKHLLTDQAVPA